MIGGGTGLAPLKSMVRHALEIGLATLVPVPRGSHPADLYDVEFFRICKRNFPTSSPTAPASRKQKDEGGGTRAWSPM